MPRLTKPLTATEVKNADDKKRAYPYKLSDGRGLYVHVTAFSKIWRMRIKFHGKESVYTIGRYPEISLVDARREAERIRAELAQGINPIESAKERKAKAEGRDSVKALAKDFLATKEEEWKPEHMKRVTSRIERDVLPYIGRRDIESIKPDDILGIMKRVEERGSLYMSKRVRSMLHQIFDLAVVQGRIPSNPAKRGLNKLVKSHQTQHRAALVDKPERFAELLRAIDSYGGFYTKKAFDLLMRTGARSIEIRELTWDEVDLENRRIIKASTNMKMRREHVFFLSTQSINILQEMLPLTGPDGYVFPSDITGEPLSGNALLKLLRSNGFTKDEMSVHGVRTLFRTTADDMKWGDNRTLELSLAHTDGDKVRAAYLRNEKVDERREVIQKWSDYLDELRDRWTQM